MIDVGCSEAPSRSIALKHEHVTGGGFDLASIESLLNAYIARSGLVDRLSVTAGDFFADPLPRADVLVVGHILQHQGLDQQRLLLQKAYTALPEGRGADRLRRDHRRRPTRERVWTPNLMKRRTVVCTQ